MAFQYIVLSHLDTRAGVGTYVTIVFIYVAGARSGEGNKVFSVNVL